MDTSRSAASLSATFTMSVTYFVTGLAGNMLIRITLHCLSFTCLWLALVECSGRIICEWEIGENLEGISLWATIVVFAWSVVSQWRGRVANRSCLEYRRCKWLVFRTWIHNCNYSGPLLRHNLCFLPSITGVVKKMTWCGGGGTWYVQGRGEIHAGFLSGGRPWMGGRTILKRI